MNAAPSKRVFPGHADYDSAVRHIGRFVFDPILKVGVPRGRKGVAIASGGEPLCYPGGFANAYVVECGAKTYALRVWLHDIGDAARHYQAVTEFFQQHRLAFFVEDFHFIPNGILVQGQRYPILRMEWVSGPTLGDFISQSLNDRALIRSAADAFLEMVRELHDKRVAHGDLQAENMVLRPCNGSVSYKLIDYDTLIVPALLGQPISSIGLPSYQHPNRSASTTATEKDDYFSELVIYICLCAVSENPSLWREFTTKKRDKDLLFIADDFVAPIPSALFQRLYRLGGTVGKLAVILWNFTRCPNIQLLLPLEKVIDLVTQPTAASPANAQTARSRSSFDDLLKGKLSGHQARCNGLPDSWLDDSSFRSTPAPVGTKARGESQADPKAPANCKAKAFTPRPLPTTKSATPSFEKILAQLQASGAASAKQPVAQPARPNSNWVLVIVFLIIASIVIIAVVNSNQNATPKPDREKPAFTPNIPASPESTKAAATPNYSHIVIDKDGKKSPAPGYKWVNEDDAKDLRVIPDNRASGGRDTKAPPNLDDRPAFLPTPAPQPTVGPLPQGELQHLGLRFTTPGPIAKGILRNDTFWDITNVTILIARSYVRLPGTVSGARAPADTVLRFQLHFNSLSISSLTSADVSADIGDYLNPYYDRGWNPPQGFSAYSRVTIESATGFSHQSQ